MVEYKYNVELEQFRRVDNRGPSLPFNITEARRIQTMMDLGIKAPSILKKIDFSHEVSMTNLRTFMNNLEQGNIVGLDEDYPAPVGQFMDMDLDSRVLGLEKRVKSLEDIMSELKTDCFSSGFATEKNNKKSVWDKVKIWKS